MELFDAHTHLHHLSADHLRTLPDILCAAGVTGAAVCATSEEDWDAVLSLAAAVPCLVPCLGVHPWFLPVRDGWLERLEPGLRATPGAALGEAGLDRNAAGWPDEQRAAFRCQLALSVDLGCPLCIHVVGAWGLLIEELERLGPHPAGLLLHAYGGSPELAQRLFSANAFFSFGPVRGAAARARRDAACTAVPLDRLLVETDAPDGLGRDGRYVAAGEPAVLARVVDELARARGCATEELARASLENARRLFTVRETADE